MEGKFRYEFLKSKPWQHNEYIAPFDFPIYKTENEINTEKDSLLKNFKPYFRYEQEVVQTQLERFRSSFIKGWTDLIKNSSDVVGQDIKVQVDTVKRKQYLSFAANLINFVYSKGIVQSDEILDRVNNPDLTIVIIRDQIAEERDLSEVFTPRTAYEYVLTEVNKIADSIPDRVDRSFYRNLNINEFLIPNLTYDEETSTRVKDEMISKISITKGMVQSGERIISRGEIVTEEKFRILESLQREFETKLGFSGRRNLATLGKVLLSMISMVVLYLFLYNFRRAVLQNIQNTAFIILMVLLTAIVASLTIRHDFLSLYVIPFALVPIMVRTFFDSRLALFVHLLTILIVGFWASNS